MACKRSAVRSRYSPPKRHHTEMYGVFLFMSGTGHTKHQRMGDQLSWESAVHGLQELSVIAIARYSPPKKHRANIVWCFSFMSGARRTKHQFPATAKGRCTFLYSGLSSFYITVSVPRACGSYKDSSPRSAARPPPWRWGPPDRCSSGWRWAGCS